MDVSSGRWFSEMGMVDDDDYEFLNQCHFNALNNDFPPSFSSAVTVSGSSDETFHTTKQPGTTNSWNSCTTSNDHSSSPASQLICFQNPKEEALSPINMNRQYSSSSMLSNENKTHQPNPNRGTKRSQSATTTRSPSHAQDHILAERKRREKLSQRFIALSAIVPGLKKMDKASVLGDAIKHVKHLQERVKVLEEQTKKRTMESVVFVKKSQLVSADDGSSLCDQNCDDAGFPEIEARVADKDVLIRIQFEKQRGVIGKILEQIEKLDLCIVNSRVLPFGNSTLDITVIAQMDDEFSMTVKELVQKLRVLLLNFI
ncbi:transcription factor bHLH25 [Tripterygium wilfordii]|uniref:transcription factor bHLH25 n=1 Tax=Tripterygium wilfordii TaxID=458696 RepID=UPI0018F84F36|nr:transcription factor bHLH25 [Tripterygium wilfordii]